MNVMNSTFSQMRLTLFTCLLSLILITDIVEANLINGSFESGPATDSWIELPAGSTAIPGWTVASGTIDYTADVYWVASNGFRSLDLSGGGPGAIRQSFATVVGRQYAVRFAMAGNTYGGPTVKTLTVSTGATPTVFTFDITGRTPTNMGWQEKVWVFTAVATTTTLTFTSLTSGWHGPALDDVRVTAVLPSCAGVTATIVGTDGPDILRGTAGNDVIQALGGNDVVHGFGGNDRICGGVGDDVLIGGEGNDVLSGEAGNNILRGENGTDSLYGNTGVDILDGGPGIDWLGGYAGNDVLVGGSENDSLLGHDGNDVLVGGLGIDVRDGGLNKDVCDKDVTEAAPVCEVVFSLP